MAGIQLTPPEPFNLKIPDDWPRWRRRFEQFRVASGLADGNKQKQITMLLYCLGEESESVLKSTSPTEDEMKDYEAVLKKFDEFFAIRKNVIYERARFNRRNQLPGETAEQYIMALYSLAANCDYKTMEADLIRDRLVVGIRDTALSERLQLDPKLDLEKAKTAIRQKESIHEQQTTLNSPTSNPQLDALHPRRKQYQRQQPSSSRKRPPTDKRKANKQCTRCGKEPHSRDKCPAKDAECNKCHKRGHFGAQCLSRIDSIGSQDTAFLDSTTTDSKSAWYIELEIGDQATTFKMDTGAEVTAISEKTYKSLQSPPPLNPPDRILCGPAQKPLKVAGQCKLQLSHMRKSSPQQVFVVSGLRMNLLGLPAIQTLGLIKRLDDATTAQTPLTTTKISKMFPELFDGLGNLGEEYEIQLEPGAKPFSLFTPRRVPLPLQGKVKEELDKMETMGVISKVDTPTPWCAGMVVAPKKSGAVRICVDLKPLNKSVLREVHPLPRVDDTLAQLKGAKLFSKLDANSGFWQIPLSPSSRLLTTFITPMGRYCFNKLPFGISSAPEHFQKRMNKILSGLKGVVCHMDDVLVFGSSQLEHDDNLLAALKRIKDAGATLNPEKCEFNKTSISFLGHRIDETGIQAEPEKTKAVREMSPPTTVTELRRFMGMVNQLGKFTPHLASITQPLRELLTKNSEWVWGPSQIEAFQQTKNELSKLTTLTHYDLDAPTKVSADASSFGLGAVLLQQSEKHWKPVAYASRSLTSTEQRYAQIEKEALGITWACEKFSSYLLGKHFEVETDHKPLVPLLGQKHLDTLPPRVLRFRLRLDRFNYNIKHVPGKEMYTADTLSLSTTSSGDTDLQELAELAMTAVVSHLPASEQRLEEYRTAQQEDPQCKIVLQYCRQGWPTESDVDPTVRAYWDVQGELTECDGMLMRGCRVVVPKSLQKETLRKIHEGHQGMARCRLRANFSVWWPGISKQITNFIKSCRKCVKDHKPNKEPLIPTPLPDYPWQQVGTDLCTLQGTDYLITVDYFSRYPEVTQLRTTTSSTVINSLKSIFARHGLPEIVRSDNGPQFASSEFNDFARAYQFCHITSSPHFPSSNGQAERAVKQVKRLLKRADDPFLALLSYRSTPMPWCGKSPAELLMGRNI